MKHNHHDDHCEHDNLKFCKACQIPYCVGCGQEWGKYNWYYSGTAAYPYSTTATQWPSTMTATGIEFASHQHS